ncbi:S26 family signal peptidase [Caulobacter segnis]|uniref:S26 family signal peptidase n=1 Tax=Caulobacter segnis TaxID=88688 RepID=UPI002858C14B|nr:S26 family signal peptidase [Caulobacter segnis]MDR6623825.1 conjugative transfer signal peptidase TraF [Caulobacter segnis]
MSSRDRVMVAGGLALVALAAPMRLDPAPRLVWNATASAPVGLWAITPGAPIAAGDTVLALAPEPARRLAAARGYLPFNIPLLKAVAAIEGDTVCADGHVVRVNDAVVAIGRPRDGQGRPRDGQGRPLPGWRGCVRLTEGAALLINPAPDSFDSRYFGPVSGAAIIGRARPLWLP